MDGKTVVVTGANSGIGLETAAALATAGARVILGCRNQETGAAAREEIVARSGNPDVQLHALDLADLGAVTRFAEDLSGLDRIDVLINNAGLILDERRLTAQGVEMVFGTNHLGPFLLTELLLPQLQAAGAIAGHGDAARIVNVASIAHRGARGGIDWDDIVERRNFRTWQVYGESKLANILHARALADRLHGTGVVAHSLHPGSISSGFGKSDDTRGMFRQLLDFGHLVLLTPEEGSRTSVFVATSSDAARDSGGYWSRSTRSTPGRWGRDPHGPDRLWELSKATIAERL